METRREKQTQKQKKNIYYDFKRFYACSKNTALN